MADNKDSQLPEYDFVSAPADQAQPQQAIRTEPLTFEERLIVQNLFDTQPKRRAEYMRQIGLELDPKDHNKYRPLGSQQPFTAEIDPGFFSPWHTPGGIAAKMKAAAKEAGMDITDVIGDVASSVVSAVTSKAGEKFGAGVVTGAAPEAGPAAVMTGQVVGAIAGGALGNAAAESAKEAFGNIVLSKDIPSDKKLMAMQSVIAGVFPQVIKGGVALAKSGWAHLMGNAAEGVVNAAKASGSGMTHDLLIDAAKNPENYTPEVVNNAQQKIIDKSKQIFGVEPDKLLTVKSTRELGGNSIFGKVANPLNKAADAELARLSAEPQANWKAGELIDGINRQIDILAAKFSRKSDEEAALSYLREKAKFLEDKAKEQLLSTQSFKPSSNVGDLISGPKIEVPKVPTPDQIAQVEFNFKEGREFLKTIQSDAYDKEVPGKGYLKQIAGGLRQIADDKAGALGSTLPQINAQRSAIMEVFKDAGSKLTPQNLTNAYVGKDGASKRLVQEAVNRVDAILGTNVAGEIELLDKQRYFDNLYKGTKPIASGRINAAAIEGAVKGGVKGAAAGAGLGVAVPIVGPKVGAVAGGVYGAMQGAKEATANAMPENILKNIANTQAAAKAANEAAQTPMGAAGNAISQLLGKESATGMTPILPKEEEQPLQLPEYDF